MPAFNAFSSAPAPIAIPTSIAVSVSFLTRPLLTTICPDHQLAHLQALLRQTLALALARSLPSTSSRAPALILSFTPNRLPPPPVLAAARAALVAWAPWMALLAPKEFDLVISPEVVKVAYQGLRPREEIVWTGKSTPVVLLSRAVATRTEDVVSISRLSRGVAQTEDEENKVAIARTSSAGLLQSLASAHARALARCGSSEVSRASRMRNTLPRTTLAPPTLPQVPSFEAPPATVAVPSPLINESHPVYQTLPTRFPPFQVQTVLQKQHAPLRPRTLAQQLLEATHDEDTAELFARLDRATAEGVLTPTPTRTAFPSTISASRYDESDTDSRPSSRSSTRSTLSTSSSTTPSERSASTAASSVDSVLFILESKTRSLSLTSFPAEQVYESSPARSLSTHASLPLLSQPFSTPSPIPAFRSRRNDFVSSPAKITQAPRFSKPHQPPVVDSKKAEKTKYLYAGGVSTVLGGGVMLGSAPRGNTEARPALPPRSYQPSKSPKGMWRRAGAVVAA